MTTLHAYGFLLLGGVLHLLPLVSPAQFPPDSLDGANTSALWLQCMGWVNGGIGTVYLWLLEMRPFVVHVLAWRPALDFYEGLESSLADEHERGAA
ncbi:hypothetical protein [Opitutus sp. GAS368]|jgi:hypothetical protein|uniref:hypothetical protein n=1 Tax=Opitutus sp. GAS368 TaxID=1882749 RepID=UPI000879CD6D|nr:hypothetical protein [Opitutus sp. GAS368]SDR79861.1 hypothetical protein SAMN05444173_0918 [Opitutus sp. GAS368]